MVCVRNLILFVEDEAMLHLDVESVFASAGFVVASALSFDEAEHVLAGRHQEICALVTDVDLGDGPSGWELARSARQAIPRLPVIYASGGRRRDFATEGVEDARFVGKPYALEHLAHLACQMLAEAGGDSLRSRDVRCWER